MYKRNYEVLDSNLDILGYREFEDNSDPDILQGSAISALVILDRVLKEYNISSSSIKGILFFVQDLLRCQKDLITWNLLL